MKNFIKTVAESTEEARQKRNWKHVIKERKLFIQKQIEALESDIDEAKGAEIDALEAFVRVEKGDGRGMGVAMEAILTARTEKRDSEEYLAELHEIQKLLFEEDGEAVYSKYELTDE